MVWADGWRVVVDGGCWESVPRSTATTRCASRPLAARSPSLSPASLPPFPRKKTFHTPTTTHRQRPEHLGRRRRRRRDVEIPVPVRDAVDPLLHERAVGARAVSAAAGADRRAAEAVDEVDNRARLRREHLAGRRVRERRHRAGGVDFEVGRAQRLAVKEVDLIYS